MRTSLFDFSWEEQRWCLRFLVPFLVGEWCGRQSNFSGGRGWVCKQHVSHDFRRWRVGGRASSEERWRSLPCVLKEQEGKLAHASHLSRVVSGVEGGETAQGSL